MQIQNSNISFWDTYSAFANTEGYVTNERLRYALKIHKSDIYELLKEMCGKGYLIAEGHGRGTRYYLPGLAANVGSKLRGNVGSNVGSNLESNVGRRSYKTYVSSNPKAS